MVAKGQMCKGGVNNDKVQQIETIIVIMSLTYLIVITITCTCNQNSHFSVP